MYDSIEIDGFRPHVKIEKNIVNHLIYGTLETKLCRICLTDGEEFQSIFDTNYIENGETWSTFHIIKEICQIEFEVDLGGVVCRKCAEDARRAYELVQRARASDCALRNATHALYLHASALAPHHYRGGETLVLALAPPELEQQLPEEDVPWEADPLVKEEPVSSGEETRRRRAMCHICGVRLSSGRYLQRHLERRHGRGAESYACHICGKVVKARRTLEMHMARHDGGDAHARRFVCDYCGAKYLTRRPLEQHIWGSHFDRRPFACTQCGKTFRTKGTMRGHAAVHVRARDHVCGVCKRGFVDARALAQHERLHSGERPFACEVCGRGFVSVGRRNTHVLTAHTAPERRCPLCPALFHLQSMVTSHMKKVHLRLHKRRRRGYAYKQSGVDEVTVV